MKRINFISSAFLFILIITVGACNKFEDMNIDPTRSSNLNPALQLAQTQLQFSGDLEQNERLGVLETMPMIQHMAGAWGNQWGGMYVKQQQYLSLIWERDYPGKILNIVDAVNRTKNNPAQSNLHAMCRIMKVYLFSRLTDLYGDIPYAEAGTAYINGIGRPKYDRQEDIYKDFFKELKEASAALDFAKDKNTQDLFYKGDVTQWKKFANSLHLRLAMRLAKRDPILAKQEVEAAFNSGVFTSNNDICKLGHENVQNDYVDIRGNGLSAAINQGDIIPYRLCNTLVNTMKATNDPRLDYIARYYIDNPFRPFERIDITAQVKAQVGVSGVNSGNFIWDDFKNSFEITVPEMGGAAYTVTNNIQKVQLANFLIANNAPFLHLTYAEVEFLLADACFRFGISLGGTYTEHYKKGLAAACNQLALFPGGPVIPEAKITQFQNDNPLQVDKELEIINTQLWEALLMNGPEAYANWRRSGFPRLLPGFYPGYSTVNTIPRRFEYPLSEKVQNLENVNAAIQRIDGGVDDWTKRVWWDKE
ncbi:MAG: SusD/RagB family nutrient-binding outer membrane lipoprotein [Gloeobacteraceae cyanobacterium ES-bin-316]|nr:SusD/RagB family nutrient-binding outer membrane lipoprotein [Ferruginibacter sp.]